MNSTGVTTLNLYDSNLEALAKWLSCNGEIWGVGPTAVFASAAALFLYNELEATVFIAGDQAHVSLLEKCLISTMVLGMLALMIHLWVCSMRFFQYYLDTLIRDSPSVLLEMTTAGLLGGQTELMPLGPLTRFLRQQQPQIHITVCWFLSLCYADYVRKHYCQRFNMPYLEQWCTIVLGIRQTELQERATERVSLTMEKVNSFVGSVHRRLRGFAPQGQLETNTRVDGATHTVRSRLPRDLQWTSAAPSAGLHMRPAKTSGLTKTSGPAKTSDPAKSSDPVTPTRGSGSHRRSSVSIWSGNRVRPPLMHLKSYELLSRQRDVRVHRTPASVCLEVGGPKMETLEDFPCRV
ncbi:uncharacterized protein LOC124637767 [Helicoverpa zea]|uniref:uncharacterized protein LOC124637767 n=1 Tax=Helicoverpa zea TaxID=7113 RepID=UPI001F5A37C0|nr:uncharacterized protein LOC124637767 [Helicoverpa zea]